ncbi:hypothetical protein PT974_12324 [Cladobotryum mycophilum]|uniref:C2H2-type domain-containing protein n=1 Tax=Cladobotryum mycophilum TaxID=491253 RepID=A0ABR0S7N9_9HYPO
MIRCSCGREFNSKRGLAQHQADKARNNKNTVNAVCQSSTAQTPPPATRMPVSRALREAWMWKNVKSVNVIQRISASTLQPSAVSVSSVPAYELVCSYSWQNDKAPILNIPGSTPLWHGNALPVTLPRDKGTYFVDQNASRVPHHRFEPLFRSTAIIAPEFRFDNVDVVSNRNSLRKLLDFCAGRSKDSFRIDLMLVNNTLFLERREKNVRELIRGKQNSGWGHSFEHAFTKFAPGTEGSTGYHRALHYPLGGLRCVVQFEIDAFYEEGKKNEEDESITLPMARLSLKDQPEADALQAQASKSSKKTILMPQATAAEIKTSMRPRNIGQYLPQLWFGRTPWLMIGRHDNGTFKEVKITDAAAQFEDWETRHQTELQKLVVVLGQLREAVRKNGGKGASRFMSGMRKRRK